MNEVAAKMLINARKAKGWTQAEAAENLATALSQTYSARQYQKLEDGIFPKFKTEIVRKLDEIFNTNLYPIVYEQNVPRESEMNEPKPSYMEQRRKSKQTHSPYVAPFIPIRAQAGYVKATDQQVYMDTLEHYALPPGITPHGAVWAYWEVQGRSMEPVFTEGDLILASQVHPMDWENIRNFYVYVIVPHEGTPVIKRVMCKTRYEWVLISENEKEFQQYAIRVEDIREVWVYRRTIKVDAAPTKTFEVKI